VKRIIQDLLIIAFAVKVLSYQLKILSQQKQIASKILYVWNNNPKDLKTIFFINIFLSFIHPTFFWWSGVCCSVHVNVAEKFIRF
jgi:hypothetical protein